MNRSGDARPSHPTAERAADLGEQVGRFTSIALRRIEAMARAGTAGPAPAGHVEAPDQAAPDASGVSRSATDRAEELLDDMAGRAKQIAPLVGPSLRRFVALAREEAEDVWAEAQEIRRANSQGDDQEPTP